MKITTRILLIFSISLALLSAVVVSMNYLASSRKQTAEATRQLYNYHELAEQLRQSSDDLTRMARTYVMTGDETYKRYYFEILAIRDGKLPRPKNYNRSYWDFVIANPDRVIPAGQSVSLVELMKQAGITDKELAILKTAKKKSDNLSRIEKEAFGAMEGIFPDEQGRMVLHRAPDPAYAISLLSGKKYHQAKAQIMRPIRTFDEMVNERIHKGIASGKAREDLYWNIVVILIITTIIFSLLAFLHFRKKVIAPIISLADTTQRILSGEATELVPVGYHDEVGMLNEVFNRMIEAKIKIEFDLTRNEQSLRTTINSIGDALIATDIYGNITLMNPVAGKLSGWRLDDAIGRPLDDVFHIINAKSRKPAINPVNIVLRHGNVIGLANHTILVSKDGAEYQISDSAAPIRDGDGDITGVVLVFRDVTEEYATRQSLQKSRARFKRLFENAEISIWNEDLSDVYNSLEQLRKDGISDLRQYLTENKQAAWDMAAMVRVVQVNKATLNLFGAESENKFFHQIDRTFGPNAIEIFIDELCAIWAGDKTFRSEVDFQTLDGTIINAVISFQIPESNEGFSSIPISIMDITDLKRAEAALRESEARLALHMENSQLAVVGCDKDFACVQWNPAAEKIFGYSREEVLGKNTVELLVPKDYSPKMAELAEDIKLHLNGQHSINENVTRDGRLIICEWFNTPLIDEHGNSVGSASLVQDITKYHLAEENLRNLSRAVEQSPVSIVITDTRGAIEYVNPQFEKTTGYTAEEVLGENCRVLKSGHTPKEEYTELWQAITSGTQWRGEFHNKRKDGSIFLEKASISPVTAEDGTITHFVAIKEDVTERRKLEEHLRRSQKMEAIGELAGGISHDFNNLLGIIIGNLDLVMRKMDGDGAILDRLQKAQNAALRGSSLTRRLLNFSHQTPEASSPANVNKIINSLKELIGKSLTRQIALETILTDELWMVEINTGDFEDMLVNLSLNARDAMPDGGRLIIETRNITINQPTIAGKRTIKHGEYVEIAISDSGTGIDEGAASRIFDPFFTTKEKDKGTGLGLAMVYSFIQRSKGYISFYSEENVGTTFRVYLPRSLTSSQKTPHLDRAEDDLPGGSGTILVVDDEEELAIIAKNILDRLGYTTLCINGADEALEILKTNDKIDLLFSDVVMAGSRDGFDLADTALQIRPDLKILLTSGFARKIQDPDVTEKWGKMLMSKPYRDAELARRVWELLNEKDATL